MRIKSALAVLLLTGALAGCLQSPEECAVAGGLAGAAIGSTSNDPLEGALVGGAVGAGAGYLAGNTALCG